jgi:hypothetical protein
MTPPGTACGSLLAGSYSGSDPHVGAQVVELPDPPSRYSTLSALGPHSLLNLSSSSNRLSPVASGVAPTVATSAISLHTRRTPSGSDSPKAFSKSANAGPATTFVRCSRRTSKSSAIRQ